MRKKLKCHQTASRDQLRKAFVNVVSRGTEAHFMVLQKSGGSRLRMFRVIASQTVVPSHGARLHLLVNVSHDFGQAIAIEASNGIGPMR
jgi:hypothetical protein